MQLNFFIKELQQLQKEMIDTLWRKLKPGGVLVYATCSILPQENEQQVASFLQNHKDAKALPVESSQEYGQQIFPGENSLDGFYLAKLQKLS
jgi:16S rRNA (cytosine967-C5)-methyltransferase